MGNALFQDIDGVLLLVEQSVLHKKEIKIWSIIFII